MTAPGSFLYSLLSAATGTARPVLSALLFSVMSRVSVAMCGLHASRVRLAVVRVDHAARRVALRTMVDAADALAIECLHDGAIDQASETFRTAYRQAVDFAGDVAAVRCLDSHVLTMQRRALVNAESLQDTLELGGGGSARSLAPAARALRQAMGSGGPCILAALF